MKLDRPVSATVTAAAAAGDGVAASAASGSSTEQTGHSQTDDHRILPSREETEAQQSVCEQRLDMWAMYQRTSEEQFAVLAELYDQLEAAGGAEGTARSGESPRTPGGRARRAVRYSTCRQLFASSQQQSAVLSADVRLQLLQLAGQLHQCRATLTTLTRLVEPDARDSAVSADGVVSAVRGALLVLTERSAGLEADLSEVSGRLERCQDRLRASPDPDPAQLRLQAVVEDRDRQIKLLQTRADNARAQSDELQKQLAELREMSSAALEGSVTRLQGLQIELLEIHTKYRDSQRQLYQTRAQLSREAASLRSERDALSVSVGRYRRLQDVSGEHGGQEREAALRALQVLNADRRRLLSRLCESETQRSLALAGLEQARHDRRLELQLAEKSDLAGDLRTRLEGSERQLADMEAEHRHTGAALREELALRTSQINDLTAHLLQAKRTIVEQEVQNDYLQQRLEDRGATPPPSDGSQLTTARLSAGSGADCRLSAADGGRGGQSAESADEEREQLRRRVSAGAQEVARLTVQWEQATRTADMLRTELRVALEALQNQRREADLRLLSSSDTRLHELNNMEQQNKELRALSTRWQLRAETSERSSRQASEVLEEERAKRLEMEASLVEASAKMREIQQQLERQDQYSTWAKLNQSLQLKQVESVMLSLLKVAPRSVGAGTTPGREAAPPAGGGGEVAPPVGGDPTEPRGILKRRCWSPPPGEARCSAGSLSSTEPEVEAATDASLATTEPERFDSLAGQPCDSSGSCGGDLITEL